MWFPKAADDDRWADAIKALRKDVVLRRLITQVGPCTLRPHRNYFTKLVQSILSQQVSVKAAASMFVTLKSRLPGKRVTPQSVLALVSSGDEELLRGCGLSRQKRTYLLDLSQRFVSGEIKPATFSRLSDDEIMAVLTPVKGIGNWTVQMLLMFGMNRPDVWPIDDLGLQEAIRIHFKLKERPTSKQIAPMGDAWKPHRTVAAWYLWRAAREY